MRKLVLIACVVLPCVLWAALPLGSSAAPQGRAAQLQKKKEIIRSKIGRRKGTERVLSTEISAYSRRINRLQGKIETLGQREARLQADLDAKRAELVRIQEDLRSERARLARLRARLVVARQVLARRLVEMYEADKPDLVTVVLNSKGFADLLERGDFIRRISDADRKIVTVVRNAKADARATAARLDKLERRQQRVTAIVLSRRDEIAQVKNQLIGTRVGYDNTRSDKQRALGKVRTERHALQEDLASIEAEQAKVQAALQRAAGAPPAGPIRHGSGQLIWPVNGPITGAFGEQRPGHIHAGIDIAAAEGTPIRAADSGRVVLLGWTGGYGNYTCIQHTSSMSTCYAHQSRYGTSMGANVSQGQVIGYVGNTGHSFGAHLHFEVRINGAPVQPLGYL
jgi:murein DD-endopeptidase MepM/ murein hydrolase activator NlpD